MKDRAHTVVEIVPYDDGWPSRFLASAAELSAVLPDAVIEHVGSTSVPGLSSKDTIDIAVGVRDVGTVLTGPVLAALGAAGFAYMPRSFADDPDHAFLHRIVDDHRTDHVHVVPSGSVTFTDYLLFRGFLRADPDAACRYGAAKLDLARRYADRRSVYVDEKQAVVDRLMDEARAWREQR
ncbi:GrpB family protein [Brachybacterium sp. JB7]|uniref:GrpB family protein n=1 Tax=Brachybacterium sp. JB7 TaxID=2024478 RepID=UPI000DF3B71D|nr:GrpB family protein [Brachybacterium sp. JB7]RCS66189.1 GrpB family protein [Brachybacterium sp. JB7]